MKGGGPVILYEFPVTNEGGGFEKSMLAMYTGFGFRVDRVDRKSEFFPPSFEFARLGVSSPFELPSTKTFGDES